MMNETIKYERTPVVMLDFEELKKMTEDCSHGQVREQGITKIREIDSRQDKRNPERTKPLVLSPLRSRRSRRMSLHEAYRTPSLFTWRY